MLLAGETTVSNDEKQLSVPRLIGIGLGTRLFIDTGVQIFFPFLAIIAQGMGITPVALGQLVSLRSFMGLFAPLFGNLAIQRGYRPTMRLGLLLTSVGFAILGFSQDFWVAALGMVLMGLGSYSFTPTLQAYVSSRLPYERRARGIGILEYSWALAGIVGLFVVGLLLEVVSWRVPFFIISGATLLAAILYGWLPAAQARQEGIVDASQPFWQRLMSYFDLGENGRSAFANIASGNFLMFGAFNVFFSYGVWMFTDFELSAASLGQLAFALGTADLVGSVMVSLISDRLGKRNSVLVGGSIACIGFALLPFVSAVLVTAVIGLLIARCAFEFAIVSNLSLLSEQVPDQRAKVMTLGAALSVVGTGFAASASPWLFEQYGIRGVAFVSAASLFFAVVLLLGWVKEPADLVKL